MRSRESRGYIVGGQVSEGIWAVKCLGTPGLGYRDTKESADNQADYRLRRACASPSKKKRIL